MPLSELIAAETDVGAVNPCSVSKEELRGRGFSKEGIIFLLTFVSIVP